MKLIIGGMYQGKLEYALNKYGLSREDVYECINGEIDYSKRIIYKFNLYIYNLIKDGIDPVKEVINNLERFKDKIIISDEISSGVVPLDKMDRLYRDKVGVILNRLASESDSVVRIFCGLEEKLKWRY